MTARIGTIIPERATDQSDAHATDRSQVAKIMRRARHWFRHKPSFELAEIVGCDVRTAERYFAGDRTPDAAALLTILRSEYGARLVEEAVADLPEKAAQEFWREMAMATLRAQVRDRQDGDR